MRKVVSVVPVPTLVKALVRHSAGSRGSRALSSALSFQTGKDFGEDTEAWKAWLEKQK